MEDYFKKYVRLVKVDNKELARHLAKFNSPIEMSIIQQLDLKFNKLPDFVFNYLNYLNYVYFDKSWQKENTSKCTDEAYRFAICITNAEGTVNISLSNFPNKDEILAAAKDVNLFNKYYLLHDLKKVQSDISSGKYA